MRRLSPLSAGGLAQRLEQGAHNALVVGSNPSPPTTTLTVSEIKQSISLCRLLCAGLGVCGLLVETSVIGIFMLFLQNISKGSFCGQDVASGHAQHAALLRPIEGELDPPKQMLCC